MARKSKHTATRDHICDTIITRVSAGEPLAAVCREMNIGLTTWYDWVKASPDLAASIARARDAGHDVIATDALSIADERPPLTAAGQTDSGFVAWQKNRVWARLQLLAKWDPKRYGDRLQTEISGELSVKKSAADMTDDELLAIAAKKQDKTCGGSPKNPVSTENSRTKRASES